MFDIIIFFLDCATPANEVCNIFGVAAILGGGVFGVVVPRLLNPGQCFFVEDVIHACVGLGVGCVLAVTANVTIPLLVYGTMFASIGRLVTALGKC